MSLPILAYKKNHIKKMQVFSICLFQMGFGILFFFLFNSQDFEKGSGSCLPNSMLVTNTNKHIALGKVFQRKTRRVRMPLRR